MTDMQTSLSLLIVWPSILNHVMHFSTQSLTSEMKCPTIYLCLAHSIPSPPMLMPHKHQPWSTNDMIHFISSHDLIGSSILTSLALHHCFGPLAPNICSSFPTKRFIASKPLTCPSLLQPVHQAKPHLDLLHLVTWLHVMSHMQWAPSSHVWALQHLQAISPPWQRLLSHDVPVD